MSWLKPKPKEHPQEIHVPQLHFIGEQDGPPERELKERLVGFFQRDQSVKAAYLARVSYDDPSHVSVVLGLRTQFGPDRGMAEKVGRIFALIFGSHEHLDILFLTTEQEAALVKVCAPFFRSI
jgi:SseB protein C-terminal domain